VSRQIENFHVTFPERLAAKDFFHRHSAGVDCARLVQVENHLLQPFNVIVIRHKV